jgi:general secretion pathway protein J
MKAPYRHVGFTLVEVLVALMIMALLAVMAWRGVDGILRTREVSQARMAQVLRVNTVLAQWEQDLQSLQDTQVVPALTFDGATLRLTRRSDNGMQLVAWALRDGAWWRWAGNVVAGSRELQEQWLASQQLQGKEPGQLRVLDGVTSWQVYFYRGNAWSNPQSSANVVAFSPAPAASGAAGGGGGADGATGGSTGGGSRVVLPTGVRLLMVFTGSGSAPPGDLTRDVLLSPHLP